MKRLGYWVILLFGATISGSVVFLSSLSVWIGATHQDRDGFWMSILAGIFAAGFVIYLFWRLSRHIYGHMNRTDSINL